MSTLIDSPKKLPSVDRLLNDVQLQALSSQFGAAIVTRCVRNVLDLTRTQVLAGKTFQLDDLIAQVSEDVNQRLAPSLQRVINLTGTVLHTNLGRAPLPKVAIDAMSEVARGASNLEFDIATGKRGDRHKHAEGLLCELTGAQRAIVVNNNAAAVLLTLNALALRKEVPVSRGELIEIGGAFRMPDIMARAGCKLIEVGTTNRTHLQDFEAAIGVRTGLVMKVHTSNYAVQGFTKSVSERELAGLCKTRGVPFVTDLGSGTLVDLEAYGLAHEPTVREAIDDGADLVTFSGDKLLGGPQAGIIAGEASLVERIKRNPMTRALRPDKVTLAALHAVLTLYVDPKRLRDELPTLRLLSRSEQEIKVLAEKLLPAVQRTLGETVFVEVCTTCSQVGSGALPVNRLKSAALKMSFRARRKPGGLLLRLAKRFRQLPVPIIGRINDDALWFDIRCLEDETEFLTQLRQISK